jgi:hypothetical protein
MQLSFTNAQAQLREAGKEYWLKHALSEINYAVPRILILKNDVYRKGKLFSPREKELIWRLETGIKPL